jgi:hypothetical protein
MDQVQGKEGSMLPWEGQCMDRETRHKLGVFKKILMDLLQRDPAERKSMADFCGTCNRILAGTTVTAM